MSQPETFIQSRSRRGSVDLIPSPWRRCAPGPNRITNIGLWRHGARRATVKPNRSGETGWRRPFREAAGGTR